MRDRLKLFLESERLTISKAEELCGFPNSTLQKFLSGTNIGSDKIEKIGKTFPSLNISWWITGYGKMKNETKGQILRDSADHDAIGAMTSWMVKMERDLALLKELIRNK